jgi:hypothetical protein
MKASDSLIHERKMASRDLICKLDLRDAFFKGYVDLHVIGSVKRSPIIPKLAAIRGYVGVYWRRLEKKIQRKDRVISYLVCLEAILAFDSKPIRRGEPGSKLWGRDDIDGIR